MFAFALHDLVRIECFQTTQVSKYQRNRMMMMIRLVDLGTTLEAFSTCLQHLLEDHAAQKELGQQWHIERLWQKCERDADIMEHKHNLDCVAQRAVGHSLKSQCVESLEIIIIIIMTMISERKQCLSIKFMQKTDVSSRKILPARRMTLRRELLLMAWCGSCLWPPVQAAHPTTNKLNHHSAINLASFSKHTCTIIPLEAYSAWSPREKKST